MQTQNSSRIERPQLVSPFRQTRFRLARPTPMPKLIKTSAIGSYLNRLLWLFTGR